MVEIANKFGDEKRWLNAVSRFRLPFWDYFQPRGGRVKFSGTKFAYDFALPSIFTTPEVRVLRPNKKDWERNKEDWEIVQNPLYTFLFPDAAAAEIPWGVLADSDEPVSSPRNFMRSVS